ncbi:alkaline phosphatase D family protein [Solicola sp. PLA-1-18]|uniref:alkaline phosphatase D family protein n=1 Tax=Solicola sp. PLA-1-18 TaxID=3380532 RepID=UPI003B7C64DD
MTQTSSTTRRTFVRSGLAVGVAGATATSGLLDARVHAAVLPVNPFTLGVASGDPLPDGVVIWTRLAVRPLADDGRGGMGRVAHEVSWEVAEDEQMRRVVRRGTQTAVPEWGHSVHVEVTGLRPGREYWYRFRTGSHVSRVARTRTAPAAGSLPSALDMSFVSCSQFEHGWFTAYRRLAEDRPDLVLHLGDYQYEYKAQEYVAGSGNVRDHQGPETVTLANYRQRHAQYKTDADLQEAHATAPWLVVWDDHEIDNNWAGPVPEDAADQPSFRQRRVAAARAYYENMPLRASSVPSGPQIQLYRRVRWGRLAAFHLLDTRQFRSDQACGDGFKPDCPEAADPRRSITGSKQEKWLLDGFRASDQRWDVIAQQVFFSQRDSTDGPVTTVSMDGWDGYAASRDRITQGWLDAGVRNPVVLTGDVHTHWAADLKLDYRDPTGESVGSELVCSSITSGGDGLDEPGTSHPWLAWNPHIKFRNNLRGYVNTRITPQDLTADFRSLPYVSTPGAEAFTRATFVVEDGVKGLQQTADNPLPVASGRLRAQDTRSDEEITRETIAWETARP